VDGKLIGGKTHAQLTTVQLVKDSIQVGPNAIRPMLFGRLELCGQSIPHMGVPFYNWHFF